MLNRSSSIKNSILQKSFIKQDIVKVEQEKTNCSLYQVQNIVFPSDPDKNQIPKGN